jgi:5'(3')-deoxyribonucleotidase
MIDTIFLDMDGVVVDFGRSVAEYFGRDYDKMMASVEPGTSKAIEELIGMETANFWQAIATNGFYFWAGAKALPWAGELYKLCRSFGPVCFLSKPIWDPQCLAGKAKWLQDFTGDVSFESFLIGEPKHHCARPGAVLIDDTERNILKFKRLRGSTILFPARWNIAHKLHDDPLPHVHRRLTQISKERPA